MTTQLEKARTFRELHQRPSAFIIPNPWDAGSARLLEALGFEALATTSSGFALTLGRSDGQVTLEEKLEHCRALSAATDLPLSADLENGFGDRPEEVAQTIRRAAETGIVGGSIEDYTGDSERPIYDLELATERIAGAVEAAAGLDFPFTLTARAENHLHGRSDLDDTLRRLQAFETAGADVLYAPGLATLDEVRAVAGAVSRPINVLAPLLPGASVDELSTAGARRISLGGALVRATVAPLLEASEEMLRRGTFGWAAGATPGKTLDTMLGD